MTHILTSAARPVTHQCATVFVGGISPFGQLPIKSPKRTEAAQAQTQQIITLLQRRSALGTTQIATKTGIDGRRIRDLLAPLVESGAVQRSAEMPFIYWID